MKSTNRNHRIVSTFAAILGLLFSPGAAQLRAQGTTALTLGFSPPSTANESNTTAYLDWTGDPNKIYRVQSALDLSLPNPWVTEDIVVSTNSGTGPIRWMAPESLLQQKYYRLLLPQPQIFTVEPAVVAPGVAVDLSVLGQCFDSNVVLRVNGATISNAVVVSSSLISGPGFTPDVAGSYQFQLVVGGLVVSSFNVVCADALANPELVLQGPPNDPPAGPESSALSANWPSKKGYDHYQAQSDYSFDIEQLLNIAGQSGGAGGGMKVVNKGVVSGGVTASQAGRMIVGNANGPGSITGGMADVARGGGQVRGGVVISTGGSLRVKGEQCDDGNPTSSLLMPALMKAKEKANQVKCGSARTIHPWAGEICDQSVDLAVSGRGLDFVWARTYNSRIGRFGSATNGWTFSYDVSIQPLGGDILIHDGTGRVDTFKLQTNGVYTCPEFFREGTLSNNTFTLTFADTGRWVFQPFDGTASAGKLVQIITRNGDTMTLGYDTSGRLVQVVDDLGRTNTMSYNTSGQLASVIDFTGRSVTYQYYSGAKSDNGNAGDLKSVTSPPVTGTPNGNDFPLGKTTTYTYSKSYPLDLENHLLLTITDPKGQPAAAFSYEHSSTDPNYLHCISAQEGTNMACRYTWVVVSRPSGSQATLKCIANDPVGNVTECFFDARNRCVIERDYTGRATPGLPVTDTDNRPAGQLRTTDPAYYETDWSWNNDSLCTLAVSPGGQQMQCVYQSDFDPATTPRKRADCRVVTELASVSVDLNGDGIPDVVARSWHYDYDPRFGSDPTESGVKSTRPVITKVGISGSGEELPKESLLRKGWDGTIKGLVVPDGNGMAINTKGTGADKNRTAGGPRFKGWDGTIKGVRECNPVKEYLPGDTAVIADTTGPFNPVKWGKLALANMRTRVIDLESRLQGLGLLSRASGGGEELPKESLGVRGQDGSNLLPGKSEVAGHNPLNRPAYLNFSSTFTDGRFATSVIDPRGNVTTGAYDTNGNRVKVQFHWDRDSSAERDFAYDTHGQLTAITNAPDANGLQRVDTFTWSQGQVTQCVVDAGGLALTSAFEYDARGNLTRCIDPRTNDWLYTYNALDECVQVQSALHANGSLGTYRTVTQYAYDANDNLVQCATELRDAGGTLQGSRTDNFSYDGIDRLSEMALAVDTTHALTNRYVYDGNNQCVQLLGGDAVSGVDPNRTVSFQYDERRLLFREIAAPGTTLSGTNEYSYTADYNPATKKYVDDSGTLKADFAYDGFDRLVSVTDAMGNQTACFYDANDNLKVVRVFGETNDVPGSTGNIRLAESHCEYDGLDRLVRAHDLFFDPATQSPVGGGESLTSFAYAPDDECVSVTDTLGHTTTFGYDTACRPVSVTDALGNQVSSVLDACANPLVEISSEMPAAGGKLQVFAVTNSYDPLSRCVSVTDSAGNTGTCAYDSLDRCVQTIDPRGTAAFYSYDLLDRCTVAIGDLDRDGFPDFTGDITTTFTWSGSSGDLLAMTDSNTNTTSYTYDSLGRCTTAVSPLGTHHIFVWNARGELGSEQDPNGTVVLHTYDLDSRCISNSITPGTGVSTATTFAQFQYDGLSRLTRAKDENCDDSFAYDSLDNGTRETLNGLPTTSTYDALGNRLSLTYPGGRALTYAYDTLNRCASITDSGQQMVSYAYDGPDRLSVVNYGNGTRTQIAYDGLAGTPNATGDYGFGQISRVRHTVVAGGAVIDDRTFSYDADQNKTARNMTQPFTLAGASQAMTFQYDPADRLTNSLVTTNGGVARLTVYVIDRMGNRTSVTGALSCSGDYTMSSSIPPGDFQMNQYTTTPCEARSYDADDNLISRSSPPGPVSYQYDYASRLVQVQVLDSGSGTLAPLASYAYDALGRRISKTVYSGGLPSATTQFLYDGDGVIEERNGTTTTATYARRDDPETDKDCGGPCWSMRRAGQDYYFHSDDQDNVLALTTTGGAVVERYDYDDFGAVAFLTGDGFPTSATSSAVGNAYCWGGLRLDVETSLHNDDGGSYVESQSGRYIMRAGMPLTFGGAATIFSGNNPWSDGGAASKNKPTTTTEPKKEYVGHVSILR